LGRSYSCDFQIVGLRICFVDESAELTACAVYVVCVDGLLGMFQLHQQTVAPSLKTQAGP